MGTLKIDGTMRMPCDVDAVLDYRARMTITAPAGSREIGIIIAVCRRTYAFENCKGRVCA